MGLQDRSFWWVACDGKADEIGGCPAGDNLDDSDQPEDAKQVARNAGFVELPDGRWLCESCQAHEAAQGKNNGEYALHNTNGSVTQ